MVTIDIRVKNMKYKFNYQPSAFELWKLSMHGIFSSMAGVTNIILTVAMLLLARKFWVDINIMLKIILIIAICLFPVIQPILIYRGAKKQVSSISSDMEIGFNDQGVHITTPKKKSKIKWSSIKGVTKKADMVIVYITEKEGYIISDRLLGGEKEGYYNYIVSRIKKTK